MQLLPPFRLGSGHHQVLEGAADEDHGALPGQPDRVHHQLPDGRPHRCRRHRLRQQALELRHAARQASL